MDPLVASYIGFLALSRAWVTYLSIRYVLSEYNKKINHTEKRLKISEKIII